LERRLTDTDIVAELRWRRPLPVDELKVFASMKEPDWYGWARSRRGSWTRICAWVTRKLCRADLDTYKTVNGEPIVKRQVNRYGDVPGPAVIKRRRKVR
jgi:hypothetical protein